VTPTWIERLALSLVPRDWRDAVTRDLADEPETGAWRAAARAAAIGMRLRLSRTRDGLTRPHTWRITFMRDFTRDLRFAIRGAVARPTYSLAVIATLAIGIGANAAIYSVFNWVLLRPIPGAAAPSELVTIRFQTTNREAMFWVSYRDYAILRDGTPALSALAASSPLALDLAVPGAVDPERIDAEIVTTNYFRMFGVTPAPGRDFLPEEERPGPNGPSVIISRRLWRDRFASSPSAIGQTLMLDGRAVTVAGVAPAGFQGRSLITTTDVWVPIGAHPQVMPGAGADLLGERGGTLFGDAFGRLRPWATPVLAQQQAAAAADAATPGFARRGAKKTPRSIAPVVYDGVGQDTYAKDRLTTMFRLVMGAVGLVLLLACANAANLLLARSLGRRREIAVCQAIGASRLRVVRQQIAEGLVLSTAAGIAGLAICRRADVALRRDAAGDVHSRRHRRQPGRARRGLHDDRVARHRRTLCECTCVCVESRRSDRVAERRPDRVAQRWTAVAHDARHRPGRRIDPSGGFGRAVHAHAVEYPGDRSRPRAGRHRQLLRQSDPPGLRRRPRAPLLPRHDRAAQPHTRVPFGGLQLDHTVPAEPVWCGVQPAGGRHGAFGRIEHGVARVLCGARYSTAGRP
jgi:MacB-like periplasmic core domain